MNLADPGALKEFLSRHGIWASKGLGQHFLVSKKVVDAIVSSAGGCKGILEIGPGPGVLTSPLSELADETIAIELDDRMIEALSDSAPRATVIKADALKEDLGSLLATLPEPRAVVSNLPYYITGPLITRIAEAKEFYSKAILMMQKEVADRVLAKPKTSARGSLSVYLQLQFQIRQLVSAPAGAFLPPPKVDSSVLEFIARPLDVEDEVGLFRLIRVGFTQPRKTLVNNLLGGHRNREELLEVLSRLGFKETARPQELSNEQWLALHQALR